MLKKHTNVKKIGTRLIIAALRYEEDLKIPVNTEHLGHHASRYLTEDGAALINHCVELRILDEKRNCGFSSPAESSDEESDDENITPYQSPSLTRL